jgi:preprotein translocase subunit Sec61beta
MAGRSGTSTSLDVLLLALILLLSLGFRCWHIQQPLYDYFSWREASTAMMADNFPRNSWNIFYPEVSWTGADPGYQGRELAILPFLTALLHSIFGWHDWFGRAVAAAFSALTVVSLYQLVRLVAGRWQAHSAALMYALLPGAILIDRSFLPEPVMLALVTTGTWLFVKYLDTGRPGLLVLSTAVFTLGVLAKLPGIAASGAILVALLADMGGGVDHPSPRRFAAHAAAITASLAAIAAYYGWTIHLASLYPPHHVAGSGYIWTDGAKSFAEAWFYIPQSWNSFVKWFAAVPALALIGVGLLAGPAASVETSAPGLRWIFHGWLLAGAVLYLAMAREISVNVWNFHYLSVPLAVFAGRGFMLLVQGVSASAPRLMVVARGAAVTTVILAAGTLPSISLWYEIPGTYKGSYAGYALGQALESLSKPGDYVVAVSGLVGDPVAIYYSRRRGWTFPPAAEGGDWTTLVTDEQSIALLEGLKARGAKWFGTVKSAKDSKGQHILEANAGLISYLDKTASRVADTPDYVIYRLGD